MVFYEYSYKEILSQVQENYNNTVIKSDIFLLIRAIKDSYFINLKTNLSAKMETCQFPEFVQGFLESYKVKESYKRIVNSGISNQTELQEKEMFKIGFLIKIMDTKIARLPEIVSFREFLLRQTPRDEIFYYLMCRNFLHKGSQLLNFINCSDPFVYVRF